MNEKLKTLLNVLEVYIGSIDPVGDSYLDEIKGNNLKLLVEVHNHLLYKLEMVATRDDSPYHSINAQIFQARKYLQDVYDNLGYTTFIKKSKD